MSLFVVSDLHIWGTDDPLYLSLISLLRDRARGGDTVILAGDLFDLFVGNKAIFTNRYSEFVQSLKHAGERGIKTHYIEGNHDFLLKRAFQGIPNLLIHPQEVSIEIQGSRFYFTHGDTADKSDYFYRVLRGFFRSALMKFFVIIAPGVWLEKFGQYSSRKSRKNKKLLPSELPLERMEKLRKVYRSFAAEKLCEGYDYVVMGHSHDLDEMSFQIGERKAQYINVGFPRAHGSFLSWSPGEEKINRERLPVLQTQMFYD